MKSIYLLGVRIDCGTEKEFLEKIEHFLSTESTETAAIVTPGPEFLVRAWKNRVFRDTLNKSTLSLPDGEGLVFFSQGMLKKRVTGADMVHEMMTMKVVKKIGIILPKNGLSTPEEVKQACEKIGNTPEIAVYWEQEALPELQKKVVDIIFVATGSPQQEEWIFKNIDTLPGTKIIMGVGGTFDFFTKKQDRAPQAWRTVGIEWLWRLIHDPKRLPRIINATLIFPLLMLTEKLFAKKV